jgi:hypothetical protein
MRSTALSLLLLTLPFLTACEDHRAELTRREIYKLAFRSAQFHEALERCEADEKVLKRHAAVWKANFDAAANWLEMEREDITKRQEAGRDGLDPEAELGCKVVLKATKVSFGIADDWAERIENEEYCGIFSCE